MNIFSQEAHVLADGLVRAKDISAEALAELKQVAQCVREGKPLPPRMGEKWDQAVDGLPDELGPEIAPGAPTLEALRESPAASQEDAARHEHSKTVDYLDQGM